MYFSPILYFCLCDFVFVGVGCGGQSWQQVDPRGVETSNTVCYRTIDSYKAVAQWTTLGIPFQLFINIYSIVEDLLFLIKHLSLTPVHGKCISYSFGLLLGAAVFVRVTFQSIQGPRGDISVFRIPNHRGGWVCVETCLVLFTPLV